MFMRRSACVLTGAALKGTFEYYFESPLFSFKLRVVVVFCCFHGFIAPSGVNAASRSAG
jgi:hypothetical protein